MVLERTTSTRASIDDSARRFSNFKARDIPHGIPRKRNYPGTSTYSELFSPAPLVTGSKLGTDNTEQFLLIKESNDVRLDLCLFCSLTNTPKKETYRNRVQVIYSS